MRRKGGLKATLVPDAADPRILRAADASKGETGAFEEEPEGVDNDGDGQINEDPIGGVNLNRNWPHRWTDFDPEAGLEPRQRARRSSPSSGSPSTIPRSPAVWTFALNDNLRAEPKKPGPSSLDDADLPLFAELSRSFNKAEKDAYAAKSAIPPTPVGGPGLDGSTDGALAEWAYHQFGARRPCRPEIWPGPDIPGPGGRIAQPSGRGGGPLALLERHGCAGRRPRPSSPSAPVRTSRLGQVEIGGWRPGVRVNPPIERLDVLVDAHYVRPPRPRRPVRHRSLRVVEAKAEAKGGGLFAISATVANGGYFRLALAMGVRNRKAPPVLVRLGADPAARSSAAGP